MPLWTLTSVYSFHLAMSVKAEIEIDLDNYYVFPLGFYLKFIATIEVDKRQHSKKTRFITLKKTNFYFLYKASVEPLILHFLEIN